jgi:methanogenic corrinoid protein MtbC1
MNVSQLINELFSTMTDEELIAAVEEIKTAEASGTFPTDGIVRKYMAAKNNLAGTNDTTALFSTTTNILKEAAYRWYELAKFRQCWGEAKRESKV